MKRVFVITLVTFICVGLYLFAGAGDSEKYELIFSHQLHVVNNEVECASCHGTAESSQAGTDNLLPDMESCGACHDVEDDENCGMCHSDIEEPLEVVRIEDYSQKFSHQLHIKSEFECSSCHSGIEKKVTPSAPVSLPAMSDCMNCHSGKSASVECAACHLPEDNLKPTSHTINFAHAHSDLAKSGTDAMASGMACADCHRQDFCQDCHEGENLDETTHPLNYEFIHALDAQGKEKDCSACHQDRQFCNACHSDYQVYPHNHQQPGWAVSGGGGLHKTEAQNDLESCISCHEQNAEETCQPCHQQ
ncbi:MAG: hypothetical protein JW956_15120 [Calditrichaceae bacterium]|nr:hypothetical protein [Calditrichaceae bacterium]